jgi:hypothetical protein
MGKFLKNNNKYLNGGFERSGYRVRIKPLAGCKPTITASVLA